VLAKNAGNKKKVGIRMITILILKTALFDEFNAC
jgi:hypothetical protein